MEQIFDLSEIEVNNKKQPVINYKAEYQEDPLAVGQPIRLYETVTVSQLQLRIKETFNIEGDDFELFEVCHDTNRKNYVRVLNVLSELVSKHGDKTLAELKVEDTTEAITHQSTWCLVVNN